MKKHNYVDCKKKDKIILNVWIKIGEGEGT